MGKTLTEILGFMGEHPALSFFLAVFTIGGIAQSIKYISGYTDAEPITRQVTGNETPDTYVEFGRTKYFSHVDGQNLEYSNQEQE